MRVIFLQRRTRCCAGLYEWVTYSTASEAGEASPADFTEVVDFGELLSLHMLVL